MSFITIYLLIGLCVTIYGFINSVDECMQVINNSDSPILISIMAFGGVVLAWPYFLYTVIMGRING